MFPDGGAKLAQPAALEVGPALIRSAPACLVADDARLCLEGEWQSVTGSWRVLYSAEDWPLRRLLTTLLGRRDFDGRLQASGWAEQAAGSRTGSAERPCSSTSRPSTSGATSSASERVEIGGGRLDLFADEDEFRAVLDMDMAASTQLRGQARAARTPGRPLADSPLTGKVRAESSVLTALPLFVPEIDRSEGRLDGDGQRRGDARQPHGSTATSTCATAGSTFTGPTFRSRPPRSTGDSSATRSSSMAMATTRKGPMTLDGRFTWPDGVMTGSMRLKGDNLLVADTPEYRIQASPDLVIAAESGLYEVRARC